MKESQNFEQDVLKASRPVLLDFFAPWCNPCRQMGLVLEEIEPLLEGKMDIVKVSVDDFPFLAQEHGVVTVPTLFVYKNGKVVRELHEDTDTKEAILVDLHEYLK